VTWSLDICSTQRSPVHRVQTHDASNQDTHLYPLHNISSVHLTTTYVRCSGRITNGMRSGQTIPQDSTFSSSPKKMSLPRRAWVWLNRLRTGIGRFRSCLNKLGVASSAACECGAEKQTVDHVVLRCPIHRPPPGLHGLMVLDDETTKWLLNTTRDLVRPSSGLNN